MAIIVNEGLKVIIVKYGPNKLFGDRDDRDKLNRDQQIELFDRVWKTQLKIAIDRATYCESDSAHKKLPANYQEYFDFSQEHREFRL
jgi:hypothetical protein